MGLFSTIAGIIGGGSQKKASQRATDALVAAYNRGIDTQNAFSQQVRQDYMPYTQAGTAAIGDYGDLLGINGDEAQATGIEALRNGPLYGALYNRGEEAILQNAAATGGLRGGNLQRGLADFGADTLASVYSNQLSNFYNMAGLGLGAQGTVTQAGGNATNNVTNLLGEIGGAKANNFLAKGRINAQNWSNVGSLLDEVAGVYAGGGGFSGAMKSLFNVPGITAQSTARLNPAAQQVISSNPKIF